jgi:hypothetical protein
MPPGDAGPESEIFVKSSGRVSVHVWLSPTTEKILKLSCVYQDRRTKGTREVCGLIDDAIRVADLKN